MRTFAVVSFNWQKYEINIILMKISKKLFQRALLCVLIISGFTHSAQAQNAAGIYKFDTIQCHIVGFNVGTIIPSSQLSLVTLSDGSTSRNATMASLYKLPWISFGVNGFYKYKSNWLVGIDFDLFFGNDNLKNRIERMGAIYSSDSIIIGTNGTDAVVTAYNRGLDFKVGVGKIIPVAPQKNPNSGILLRLNGGMMFQQTIFTLNEVNAPQLDGDYALLYDHQRRGLMLNESVGFWFMSNRANLINFYISFDVTQCWSKSTRDYIIDDYLGIRGKDNSSYFDLLYSIKLCWMFPLKGKSSYDYYYY